jgi:serine/threonine protein phosphatase PrpC
MHKGAMNGDEFLEKITATTEANAALLQEGPLIATPDIVRRDVDKDDEFLIIATDGVWDVLTSQEAVLYVRRYLVTNGGDVDGAAKGLVRKALVSGTVDNVSAVVVALNQRMAGGEEKTDVSQPSAAPEEGPSAGALEAVSSPVLNPSRAFIASPMLTGQEAEEDFENNFFL